MNIQVEKLEMAMSKLFKHLKKRYGDSISIDSDFFWNIPAKKRYDSYDEPKQLDLGQLSDSWSEVEKIADSIDEPLTYGFVWLSDILRVIGEEKIS